MWCLGSGVLLDFSGLRSFCCVVGVAGVGPALVHQVVPVGEMASAGQGATMPIGVMA